MLAGLGIGDWSERWGCRMFWWIVMWKIPSLPEDEILDDERGPRENGGYKKFKSRYSLRKSHPNKRLSFLKKQKNKMKIK